MRDSGTGLVTSTDGIEGSDTLEMVTITEGFEGTYASLTKLVNLLENRRAS